MDLDRDNFWKTFAVMIQLGAILAILWIYFGRLWRIAVGMFSDPAARRFVIGVLLAFFPAVVLGLLFGGFIKSVLFNPWVVCFSLIAGGAVLLWVDQQDFNPRYHDATTFSLPMYLGIGIAQCAAMIPGVSRSGASIVAAMLFGADKRAAAEFSFFLAIPTMVGAFAYDFYKSRGEMTMDHSLIIAVGFVVSFITAIIVVKTFLGLRHPPRLRAVRLVARDRRLARPGRARAGDVIFSSLRAKRSNPERQARAGLLRRKCSSQ